MTAVQIILMSRLDEHFSHPLDIGCERHRTLRVRRRLGMIRLEKDVVIERSINDVFSFVFHFENEPQRADEVV